MKASRLEDEWFAQEADILAALASGPKTITKLAGGSMSYRRRAPIRAVIDSMLKSGAVRPIGFGKSRAFAATDWRVDDDWLLEHFATQMRRDGDHLIWTGNWDTRWNRAVLRIDGERYDVRRTLLRIKRNRHLKLSESVFPKCEHERCMSLQCLKVQILKGAAKHNIATRAKLADMQRSRSKYGADLVARVKAMEGSYRQIATATGMKLSTVGAIKGGRIWKDFSPNPWAGMGSR